MFADFLQCQIIDQCFFNYFDHSLFSFVLSIDFLYLQYDHIIYFCDLNILQQ